VWRRPSADTPVLLSVPKPPRITTAGRCFHACASAGSTDSTRGRAPGAVATSVVMVITGHPLRGWSRDGRRAGEVRRALTLATPAEAAQLIFGKFLRSTT